MIKLCGVDSSTSATAISFFEDGKFKDYSLIKMDKKQYPNQWERVNPMLLEIKKVLDKYKPNILYQEDSWKGNNVETLKSLTNILGGTRFWCITNECEYYKLMPSAWRSVLKLQKYEAQRPELKNAGIEFVKEKYNIDVPCDDVSDAILVGLAGLKTYGLID